MGTNIGINAKNEAKFVPQWIPLQWRVFLGLVLKQMQIY